MQQKSPKIVKNILVWQLVVVLVLGIAGTIVSGMSTGLSAVAGALVCWIPNALAARLLFAKKDADPRRLTAAMYRAELGKFIITATLFAVVFIVFSGMQPIIFFGAYIATYGVQWLLPLCQMRNR